MRVALISDIHGNRWALEAVLEHLAARAADQRVDAIWNLGDILSGPLAPAATAELLIPLALPTIAGNHERQLLACAERPGGASDQYAFEHTEPRHRDWLRGLPATLRPAPEILLCHGTPSSDLELLLETVEAPEQRAATPAEIAARLAGEPAPLIACGHSHVARLVRTRAGGWIVNPGSVGLPAYDSELPTADGVVRYYVDNGTPHASYAVAEAVAAGWQLGFHRVAYDWEAAAQCAARNHRPEWAHALRTGFALRT